MLASALVLVLPLLTVASPYANRRSNSTAPCSTGSIQCCNKEDLVKPYSNVGAALISTGGFEEHPRAYYGDVAASCSTGIGLLNGGSCSGQTVCCSATGGLISIGCVPISL